MGKFFGNGSGDLTRALRRIARQPADGVPANEADYIDFWNNGGPMSIEPLTVPRAALTGGSVRGRDLPGKVDVSGISPIFAGDLDPGNKAQGSLFLGFFRGKKVTVTGDVTRTVFADYYRENDGGVQVLDKLSMVGDDDKGFAIRSVDIMPSGFVVTLQSKANLKVEFPIAAGPVDFHGVPTHSGLQSGDWQPHLRHYWSGNLDDVNDNQIVVTFVSQGLTSAVLTCRVGASGTESSNQAIPYNEWTRLYYSSDNLKLGPRRNWIEIYLPQSTTTYLKSGGTLSAAGSPDATVSLVSSTWNLAGVEKSLTGPVLTTLNQTDGASAALTSGNRYYAVITLNTSTSATVVTKGTQDLPADAAIPATPAGHVHLGVVAVDYQAGGTSIIESADIDQSAMKVLGYPAGDSWAFPARRARWSPSLGTERVVPEVNCRVKCNGTVYVFDKGVTITGKIDNVETIEPPGGAQPTGTFRSGFVGVEIAVSRRYIDKNLEVALLNGTPVSFELEAKTDIEVGDSGVDYGFAFIAPECMLTGKTVSAGEGAANPDESLVLLARMPADGATYTYEGTTFHGDFAVILDSDYEPA